MPRANDYLLEGRTYHLTHRCHDRRFLLKFARDRNVYREWIREGVKRHRVPLFGFCITRNHVHLLVHADNAEDVSRLVHLAAGSTAKQFNVRKARMGAMWEHPYHCTVVEGGRHLMNCLVYINLNMVRAGVVKSPADWKWCGHDELLGLRKRYRTLDLERLMQMLGVDDIHALRAWYSQTVDERLATRQLQREAYWTEALAVGSRSFVEQAKAAYPRRQTFEVESIAAPRRDVWAVHEGCPPYPAI